MCIYIDNEQRQACVAAVGGGFGVGSTLFCLADIIIFSGAGGGVAGSGVVVGGWPPAWGNTSFSLFFWVGNI